MTYKTISYKFSSHPQLSTFGTWNGEQLHYTYVVGTCYKLIRILHSPFNLSIEPSLICKTHVHTLDYQDSLMG